MIRIISKKEGFRRCGVAHPAKAKDYPKDFFTKAQLKRLKSEPMLVVQELPDTAASQDTDPEESSGIKKTRK